MIHTYRLKGCPFCRSTDLHICKPKLLYYIECTNCYATLEHYYLGILVTKWNTRTGGRVPVCQYDYDVEGEND